MVYPTMACRSGYNSRMKSHRLESVSAMMVFAALLVGVFGTTTTSMNVAKRSFVEAFDLSGFNSYGTVQRGRRVLPSSLSVSSFQQRYCGNCSSDLRSIVQNDSSGRHISTIVSIRGGGEGAIPQHTIRKRRVVPILVALTIGSFSVIEILESLHNEVEFFLGHAHGIFIISLVRLFRELAILQTQAEEFTEAVEELNKTKESEKKTRGIFASFRLAVTRFVISRNVSIVACLMAAFTSLLEAWNDLKPGGHHGAVFLALSQLNYQLKRFSRIRNIERGTGTKPARTTVRILSSSLRLLVGPLLFLAAAAFAAIEIYEDLKPGAHHAVAVLALAELVENLNNSKILDRKPATAS